MLNILTARERGIGDSVEFQRNEVSKRLRSLELSKQKDVERIFKGNVNTLDVDLIEKRYLLSGGADGYIVIYDIFNFSGQVKHTCPSVGTIALNNKHRHKYSVETVLWYPLDTGLFTSSGTDKILKVWDTNRLKPADEYEFSGVVFNHHMSSVATRHCLIAVASESSSVKLVDLKSGSATHTLKGHNKGIMSVRWSPYNEFLLASGSADSRVFLWDIRNAKGSLLAFDQHNGKRPRKEVENGISSHSGKVNGLHFTADGLHLVSMGTDNKIHLWNTTSGRNTHVNYGKIWNSGRRNVQLSVSQGAKHELIFCPHGKTIDVFDTHSGSRLYTLNGHYGQVNACYYHPDIQELYSGGNDRNILVWTPAFTSVQSIRKETCKVENEQTVGSVQATSVTADSWSSDEES